MTRRITFRIASIATVFVAVSLMYAHASERDPVLLTMQDAARVVAQQGYTAGAMRKYGVLAGGATDVEKVRLHEGGSYVFVAVCEESCGDLDLTLLDGAEVVASDTAPHALPMLILNATHEGEFELRIVMKTCRTSGCAYYARQFQMGDL